MLDLKLFVWYNINIRWRVIFVLTKLEEVEKND